MSIHMLSSVAVSSSSLARAISLLSKQSLTTLRSVSFASQSLRIVQESNTPFISLASSSSVVPLLFLTASRTSLPNEEGAESFTFCFLPVSHAKIPVRIGFRPPIILSITATLEPPLPALVIAK